MRYKTPSALPKDLGRQERVCGGQSLSPQPESLCRALEPHRVTGSSRSLSRSAEGGCCHWSPAQVKVPTVGDGVWLSLSLPHLP